ncbi:MAG: hypothetical protein ABI968_09075 [Acidobacteriota bacterium]
MTLCRALLAQVAVAARPGDRAPVTLSVADTDLLRRILAETGVQRSPAGPGLWPYLRDLLGSLLRALSRSLSLQPLGEGAVRVGQLAAGALIATAAALLLLSLARGVRRRRGPPSRNASAAADLREDRAVPDMRDRAAWRAQIDALLARGDVAGALQALWWWLARSLAPAGRIDPSQTTRELLIQARRMDLARLGDALDVLMYGRRNPSGSDVSACLARWEEAVR